MYKNITYMIAGAMVVMCLIFACYLIFTDLLRDTLYGTKRNILIAMLLAYGGYRCFRLYAAIQKDKRENR